MLVKHFKELLSKLPDDMVILFDDGSGIYMPLGSSVQMKVSTFCEPGDPEMEFYNPEDLGVTDDDEYDSTMYGANVTTIDAVVFSTDQPITTFEGP